MSNTNETKNGQKKQVIFMNFKPETLSTININNDISRNSMIVQKFSILTSNQNDRFQSTKNIQLKRSSILQRRLSIESKSQSGFEELNNQNNTNKNDKKVMENQATLDLLDKIRHSAIAAPIGPMVLSQQACRFELPFDLKLLETLTPLDYLTKYCRLSPRRQYQFKRIFDKYRNRKYRFESSYLYLSLLDLHKENFTHIKFDYLCQLIDLDNQQYQFTFDTYAGILALCERILYKSTPLYNSRDDYYLTKDAIEKCDFYSLDRKFDRLVISDTMKRLLNALQ